jgi:hypothetical protein
VPDPQDDGASAGAGSVAPAPAGVAG